jgi:hypothetical protein
MRWAWWASEEDGIIEELNIHPIAEVLSPSTGMHSCSSWESKNSSHTFMTMPIKSNRLLTRHFQTMGFLLGCGSSRLIQ